MPRPLPLSPPDHRPLRSPRMEASSASIWLAARNWLRMIKEMEEGNNKTLVDQRGPLERQLYSWWIHRPHIKLSRKAKKENKDRGNSTNSISFRPWEDLGWPFIEIILSRLSFFDRVVFGMVCRSWHEVERAFPSSHYQQLPWLMVPPTDSVQVSNTRIFCSPSERALYTIEIPGIPWQNCFASSHGWLLLGGSNTPTLLVNPVTRVCVNLPRIIWADVPFIISSFSLSSSATDPDCIALYVSHEKIYFCHVGDEKWTIHNFDGCPRSNAVAFGGKFYFLTDDEQLAEFDVRKEPKLTCLTLLDDQSPAATPFEAYQLPFGRVLMESSGKLLLVTANRSENFMVWKVDFSRNRWMVESSLDGWSLFIGYGCAFSLPASRTGDGGGRMYISNVWNYQIDRSRSCLFELWQEYMMVDGVLVAVEGICDDQEVICINHYHDRPLFFKLFDDRPLLWIMPGT